ncbi:hypothetical protein V2J09_021071 [Rumex salicifolius]
MTYYLHLNEDDPVCSCQSKNFTRKVEFLAAIARLRFNEEGNEIFSRKIGTLETRPITSVKKETILAFLLKKVIPVIHAKCQAEDLGRIIFIQKDNARTSFDHTMRSFKWPLHKMGSILDCVVNLLTLRTYLDLVFFSAIQSLQHKDGRRAHLRCLEYETELINHVF